MTGTMTGLAPPPRWLVACDLDQTLIYSRQAFRLLPGAAEPPVLIVEYLDGEPLSHMGVKAAADLRELCALVPVVPVTTRTMAQYGRIELGFAPSYAIAANGGHLLVDGVADLEWERQVRDRLASSGAPLEQIRKLADELAAGEFAGVPWVRTIRDADGFFVYLVATERSAIPDLGGLTAELAAVGWTVSVQGRKIYLVPAALTKERAIAEVMSRTGAARLAAAGDSLLDLGMLQAADAAVRPAHGELHDQDVRFAHLAVSAGTGLLAGEEIIGLLREIVARAGDSRNANVTFPVHAG